MITKNGKRQHLNVIAGKAYSFADRFVLGASSDVLDESATDLDFSWGSFPITDSIVDEELNQVIFYGTIPAELAGEICEIGLSSIDSSMVGSGQPVNRTFFFGHEEGWVSNDIEDIAFVDDDSQMGPEDLIWTAIAPEQRINLNTYRIDVSDVTQFKTKITAEAPTTVEIAFYSNDTESIKKEFVLAPGANYIKEDFSQFIRSEFFDSHGVVGVSIRIVEGSGSLKLDCIILTNFNNGGLVVREVPANPIKKISGSSMEVEMAVMLGV